MDSFHNWYTVVAEKWHLNYTDYSFIDLKSDGKLHDFVGVMV